MNTSNERKVKRGELYFYDFGDNAGSIQSGLRPVLVVQCDAGNQVSPTTVIAAVTSVVKKQFLPFHIFLGENYGLKKPSMVLLEQIKTVNQTDLTEYIGIVDSEYLLRKIKNGLFITLVGASNHPKRRNDIRCLCPKCLEDYKSNPDYVVKRLDPFQSEKQQCDKCNRSGYDYLIYEKHR